MVSARRRGTVGRMMNAHHIFLACSEAPPVLLVAAPTQAELVNRNSSLGRRTSSRASLLLVSLSDHPCTRSDPAASPDEGIHSQRHAVGDHENNRDNRPSDYCIYSTMRGQHSSHSIDHFDCFKLTIRTCAHDSQKRMMVWKSERRVENFRAG